jgi:integrase
MLDSQLQNLLNLYNQALSKNRPKVIIEIRGLAAINLRASLPNAEKEGLFERQRLPLSDLADTTEGLALAYQRALELQTQLRTNTFSFERWPTSKTIRQHLKLTATIDTLIPKLEAEYFKDRPSTATTSNTWKESYLCFYKKIPKQKRPTFVIVDQHIRTTYDVSSRQRQQAKVAFGFLAKFLNWTSSEVERLKKIESNYKVKKRTLEKFEDLVALGDALTGNIAIAYRLLLTYGCRPSDLFMIDPASLAPEHKGIIQIKEGGKSKSGRVVAPAHTGLYERWELWTIADQLPTSTRDTLKKKGAQISQQFKRAGIAMPAYDLRHTAAAKFRSRGVPSEIAARSLGHRTSTHESAYLAHMRQDQESEALLLVLENNPDRVVLEKELQLPKHLQPVKPKTKRKK